MSDIDDLIEYLDVGLSLNTLREMYRADLYRLKELLLHWEQMADRIYRERAHRESRRGDRVMADALAELTGRLESVDDSGLSVLETAQLKALREAIKSKITMGKCEEAA